MGSWQTSLDEEDTQTIMKMLEKYGVNYSDGDDWYYEVSIKICDEDGLKNPVYIQRDR